MYTSSPLYILCYSHQTANQNELTASSQVNHCPSVHVAHVVVTDDITSSHSRQYITEHKTFRTQEWVLLLSRNCGSIGFCGKGKLWLWSEAYTTDVNWFECHRASGGLQKVTVAEMFRSITQTHTYRREGCCIYHVHKRIPIKPWQSAQERKHSTSVWFDCYLSNFTTHYVKVNAIRTTPKNSLATAQNPLHLCYRSTG